MTSAPVILEFNAAAPVQHAGMAKDSAGVDLRVSRSDLIVVRTHGKHEAEVPLFDMAQGLVPLSGGSISFLGEDWSQLDPFRQDELRGRIGRVFSHWAWISNLNLYDNVTLSQRHHTTRNEGDIRREVEALSAASGLDDLPGLLPDAVTATVLRKAEWVRAFMGTPSLVLLENPESGTAPEDLPRLMGMITAARAGGTAVVWETPANGVWQNARLGDARHCEVRDGKFGILSAEEHNG